MGTSVSSAVRAHIRTFAAAAAAFAFAFALALGLAPVFAFADDAQVDSVAGPLAGPGYEGDAQSASPNSSSDEPQQVNPSQDAEASRVAPMLASGLFGSPAGIISSDVALDAADPVVGSFTVDGLTFAVGPDGLTLVAVAPDAVSDGAIAVPATVTYDGTTYSVTAIGLYAFYLSGAASVELPDSIASVDNRAFHSSDVARVTVDPANPNIASYEGALYSADLSSLLLIPEGRAGSVPIPSEAEVVEASKFSHCSLVDAISVDGDGAAFASWEGLLYDASGTTLLRVPAGATEITIRDGCTTIAAGALEGCAKLERINAPASVISISPDVFQSVPTISLPAQMAVQDVMTSGVASGLLDQANASTDSPPQLTAMVALSTADDNLPKVDPLSIEVILPEDVDDGPWAARGFAVASPALPQASFQERGLHQAYGLTFIETIGVSAYDGVTSLWPAADDVFFESMTNVHADSGRPNYNFFGSSHYQNGYYKCTTGIYHMYQHSRYGYLHVAPDVWGSSPDSIMIAKDAKTGRRLKVGPYSKVRPPGITLEAARNRPITFGGYFLPFSLSFDATKGAWEDGSSAPKVLSDVPYSTSKQVVSIPQPVAPAGWRFTGWHDANGSLVFAPGQLTATSNISQFDEALSAGNAFELHAQWELTISADVPLEVTARVDLLGIEEQAPAAGYIESRCGEALKVAEVGFEPLPGAAELFGAGNEAQVWLHAHANGVSAPFASFALDAAATESDPAALAPLTMASYGTRVPVGYRFDIPDALLPSLAEATLPVCQVSYTVALA